MSLAPSATEIQARARVDLRMGVPVVFSLADQAAVVAAAETLSPARLAELRVLGPEPVLAITARRAETLRAVAYSDIVARVALPRDVDCAWVQAVADPADDLRAPMKGPLKTLREGDETLHRAAIELCKAARLLPAALVVGIADGQELADRFGLTKLDAARASSFAEFAARCTRWFTLVCRWRCLMPAICMFSGQRTVARNITRSKLAGLTAASQC